MLCSGRSIRFTAKEVEDTQTLGIDLSGVKSSDDFANALIPWISALGEVRDRDVLLASLRAELANVPAAEKPGIERLIARVEQERAVAREAMERFLDSVMSGPLQSEVDRRFGPHGQTVKTPVAKNGGQL
mgnify:CR=1 FL=1